MIKQPIGYNFKKRTTAFAVAAVMGLTVVTGGGAAIAMTNSDSSGATMTQQSQVDHSKQMAGEKLRVDMNNLLRQHVTSSLDVTRAITGGGSERMIIAAEETQRLNSDDLSAAIGSLYGPEAQSKFATLFTEHIMESNAYAKAVANGDAAAKEAALMELQEYLHDIAGFFSGAIPGLPEDAVYGLLSEHENLINKATEAYSAGDYVQSYQMERAALNQISGAADALSDGIIASMPQKFE